LSEGNCGCSTDLPPILIEVNADGTDNVKYSGKCEQDIDQMVRELGADASAALLYCHTCNKTFFTRNALDRHKEETGHT
jgi:Zinc-finger double-stranded RNA-binding